jgi:hypothetical protein
MRELRFTMPFERLPLWDDGILSLPPSMERLFIKDSRITPAIRFSHLPRLTSVTLDGCALSDAAIASLPPTVTQLSMRGATGLTDALRLDHLPHLTDLIR